MANDKLVVVLIVSVDCAGDGCSDSKSIGENVDFTHGESES